MNISADFGITVTDTLRKTNDHLIHKMELSSDSLNHDKIKGLFPEIDFDSIPGLQGMNISIVTTAKNDQETKLLLETFGVPFANN